MYSDAAQALSCIDDFLSSTDLPRRTGRSFTVPNWKCKCVGDDICSMSENVVRMVAFQTAGCIGELGAWVDGAVSQLRCTGAHVGVDGETRVHSVDRHTRIINAFKSHGFLALSHNTSSRSMDFAPGSPEDDVFGPRAAVVITVVSDKYAGGWTDIAYDTFGRAIAANLELSDGATVRIVGAHGVRGSNCANFCFFPCPK